MLIPETDTFYHTKLKESRKRLIFTYVQLFQSEQQEQLKKSNPQNQTHLQALYAYILHINSGQIPISLNDSHYLNVINKIPSQLKLEYLKCKNVAEVRARREMMEACLREILVPLLATILPSFIIGAGIVTAVTNTGTLAAIIFFFVLGSLMLLSTQLYLWRHHRKDVPHRIQRLNQLFSDLYQRPIEKQDTFEGEAFPLTLLQNVLDGKQTLNQLEMSANHKGYWSFLSSKVEFLTLKNTTIRPEL